MLYVAYKWILINLAEKNIRTHAELAAWTTKDMDGLLAIYKSGMIWMCFLKIDFRDMIQFTLKGLYKQYALESGLYKQYALESKRIWGTSLTCKMFKAWRQYVQAN